MAYFDLALKGFSWMTLLRGSTRGTAVIKTIVLAKILAPADLGAYGVALLILGFLEVMTETGVNVILIQEKNISKLINSAWVVSIIRGFFISFLIIISAPFVANFFNSQESLYLIYIISIVPLLRGLINPSVIKFQKELRFNLEFIYRTSFLLVDAGVSITLCFILKSPIGIAIGMVLGVLLEVVLSHLIIGPHPKLEINKEYIAKIVHRGKWVTLSGVFNYLYHNADNIIVGRLLGTGALGIYQIAYSISSLAITEVTDVVSRVTFPIFSSISDDKKRLKRAFIRIVIMLTLVILPFGFILFLFSKEIVIYILGEKWLSIVDILPILAAYGVIRAVSGYSSTLFLAVNKQEYVSIVTVISLVGLLIPILPLISIFGLKGAAYAVLIGTIVAVPFFLYYTLKVINTKNERS